MPPRPAPLLPRKRGGQFWPPPRTPAAAIQQRHVSHVAPRGGGLDALCGRRRGRTDDGETQPCVSAVEIYSVTKMKALTLLLTFNNDSSAQRGVKRTHSPRRRCEDASRNDFRTGRSRRAAGAAVLPRAVSSASPSLAPFLTPPSP